MCQKAEALQCTIPCRPLSPSVEVPTPCQQALQLHSPSTDLEGEPTGLFGSDLAGL